MIKRIFYILIGITVLYSCRSGGEKPQDSLLEIPDSVLNEGVLEISEEVMQDIVQNISSPVEMAYLVKELGVPFSNKYLSPTDNLEDMNNSFKQAFNLGIYGADLGYLNMYNKTSIVIDYISSIKVLSDALKVGQFFDFTTLKRLAQNNQNLDSLMYISVHSFNQMDKYLRTNNRSNLSALIVAGVWMEGLYLATQVAKEAPHPQLAERIGDQKILLNDLILILENYKSDKQFKALIDDLKVIKDEFKDVTITIEKGEPEAIEEDGMLVIVQNDVSIVHITDERLKSIINKTEEIRNRLINL
ncbi:MAG: hypothetical protein JXJ22_07075 [Bacteroidales bacterium]|nr:hypothetical protein [Bacteroidales bacterium]